MESERGGRGGGSEGVIDGGKDHGNHECKSPSKIMIGPLPTAKPVRSMSEHVCAVSEHVSVMRCMIRHQLDRRSNL